MKIEIRKSVSKNPFNRYYYAMVADNGEVLSTSEMYFSKSNAIRGATALAQVIHCKVVDTTNKPYSKHGGFK